jgi:hypothetical protein
MAAILSVFGINGQKFIDDYRDSRAQAVRERSKSTTGHALIDAILTTNFTSKEEDSQVTNIKSMLLMAQQREKINQTHTGVYYDEVSQCIGIAWSEVKQNLLRSSVHRNKTAFALKSEAETASDWVLERQSAEKMGIVKRLLANGMTGTNDIYTVITTNNLIALHESIVREVAAEQAAASKKQHNTYYEEPDLLGD